jgi:hypothetical protein
MDKFVYIVLLHQTSDPYEPELTKVDAVFGSQERADAWVEYRMTHVKMLAKYESRDPIHARYGFEMAPSLYDAGFGPQTRFSVHKHTVMGEFTGEEYPDEVI